MTSNTMRILTFLHSFEPGGVERTALALAGEWHSLGHEMIVWLGRRKGAMADRVPCGIRLEGPAESAWPVAHFETIWMLWHLPAAVRQLAPNVLFCAGNSYTIVAAWLRLRLGRDCPPIVAKISNDLERKDMSAPIRALYRLWLRLQGKVIDQAVAMDAAMVSEIAHYLHYPLQRVCVVEDPSIRISQIVARQRTDSRSTGRRFVALGRLAAQKNYRLMIQAFAKGSRPDDRLVIHGEGPDRRLLEAFIAQLGLAGRVEMPGYVADPHLALEQADVLLLSSDYEGVPAVIIEALAVGIQIIATDCSASMAGLLGHGALGALIGVGDVTAFAAAIAEVEPDGQDLSAAHSLAARFTVERAGSAYLRLFEEASHLCKRSTAAGKPIRTPHGAAVETGKSCC